MSTYDTSVSIYPVRNWLRRNDEPDHVGLEESKIAPLWPGFDGDVIATLSFRGCLALYTWPAWETMEQELTRLDARDPAVQALLRLMLEHWTPLERDRAGRYRLPRSLVDWASLSDQILVLPLDADRLELWNEKRLRRGAATLQEWLTRRQKN